MAEKAVSQGFLIEASLISEDNEVIDISSSVLDVMIKKDFIKQNLPLFVIDLKTTEEYRDKIRDEEIKIGLNIYSYDIDAENSIEETDETEPTITGQVLNTTIRLYDKPFTTTTANKEEDSEESQSSSAPFIYYRVAGVPEDIIEKNSSSVNKAFSDITINEAIVNILSDIGFSSAYIQNSDNTETEKSLLIPPMSPLRAIEYIDDNFQIYNGLCRVFFDYDNAYVYDPFANESEQNGIMECNVIDEDNTTGVSSTTRVMADFDNKKIKLTLRNFPGYSEQKRIVGNSIGKQSIFSSYDEFFNLVQRTETSDIAYDKVQYYWNAKKKSTKESSLIKVASKTAEGLSLNLQNISPELFTPLLTVKINSKYSEPDGIYFINSEAIMFSTNDMKHYSSLVNLQLTKR